MILQSAGVLTTAITAITEIEIARITCTLSYWHGKGWQSGWLSRDLAYFRLHVLKRSLSFSGRKERWSVETSVSGNPICLGLNIYFHCEPGSGIPADAVSRAKACDRSVTSN
jgi:hypothetical protein